MKIMADDKPVHEQVRELLDKWNPPAKQEDAMARLVGVPVPEGDTRATATVRPEEMDHDRNPAASDVDAQRMLQDDGDDEEGAGEPDSYDDMTVDDLKDELRRRDLPVSGNKAELVARLEEDDEE